MERGNEPQTIGRSNVEAKRPQRIVAEPASRKLDGEKPIAAVVAMPAPRPGEPMKPKPTSSAQRPPAAARPATRDAILQRAEEDVVKSAKLTVRKHPYITAAVIDRVGDLRNLQILSGQGNWKRVKIATTGTIGWVQLTRIEPKRSSPKTASNVSSNRPAAIPKAPLLSEAKLQDRPNTP